MSKIGRRPIDISGVKAEIKGDEVHYKGPKGSGVYFLPKTLKAVIADDKIKLVPSEDALKSLKKRELNQEWGLHRALLANNISGAKVEFDKVIEINGLGFKAVQTGQKLVFTLGYSHKIDFALPKEVTISIDKTGQKLTFRSSNKELLGQICSTICSLRSPEPYKGTGIKLATQQILRKAGKTK